MSALDRLCLCGCLQSVGACPKARPKLTRRFFLGASLATLASGAILSSLPKRYLTDPDAWHVIGNPPHLLRYNRLSEASLEQALVDIARALDHNPGLRVAMCPTRIAFYGSSGR